MTASATTAPARGSDLRSPARGLYDALGREVAVLHDGDFSKGTHALWVVPAGWASGLYLLSVHATDESGAHARYLHAATRSTLFALLAVCSVLSAPKALAQTWPEPGEGFVWENVGDVPVDAERIIFDTQDRLWAAGSGSTFRLDNSSSGEWEELDPFRSPSTVLPFGRGDTTLSAWGVIRRTADDGVTWTNVGGPNAGVLVEVPQASSLPGDLRAGHLLAGHRGGTNGTSLSRSTDRGATWSLVPGLPGGSAVADLLVLPAWHEHSGRLIAPTFIYGAYLGATDADTGALVMKRTLESEANIRRALEHLALFPSGRILATGYVGGQPDNRTFVSDDGGETWRETARLPEPSEGIPGDAWILMLGGPSALAVGGRGVMYRTDDEGETWAIVGRTPVTDGGMTSQEMVLGPEGHLYLALKRVGTDRGWVMRTAGAVVSSAPVLPEASGASLRVTPNPASGAARVTLSLPSPEAATLTVFDARGREVHAEASGARMEHAFRVDTSAWAPGVYVVRAEVGSEALTAQITIAR